MNRTAKECYSKHEYPPWYKQKGDQDKGGDTQKMCNLNSKSDAQESVNQGFKEENVSTSLSAEQIQKLLRLLDDKNKSNHIVSHIQKANNNVYTHKTQQGKLWILCTRAIDHVTHDIKQLSTFFEIKPIIVRLPNNSTVIAKYVGTKYFSKKFMIFNVLYILEFSFNLISVQSLIKDLNCRLIFSDEHCQIQHNTSYMKIGRASMLKGLYYLDDCPHISEDHLSFNIALNCSKDNIDVWHYRLGHPCDNVTK